MTFIDQSVPSVALKFGPFDALFDELRFIVLVPVVDPWIAQLVNLVDDPPII
ncbi:hypothetical protein ES708_26219 [subsurface metagenome]